MEGNIVVDGELASCYPSSDHDLAHIGMTPMRWFPEIIEWIYGGDIGFSIYARMQEDLGLWVLPFGQSVN